MTQPFGAARTGCPMVTGEKPSIVGTAVAGWRDAFASIAAMPTTCGITFVLVLALSAANTLLVPQPAGTESGTAPLVAGFITGIIQSFVIAPLAIAVHRYVLLGEVTAGYAIDPSSPRYLRFVSFAVLINVLMFVPSLIFGIMPADSALGAVGGVLAFILVVISIIVLVRRTILFPAIAVDAPGATWTNARNDTMGHSWRVFFIMVCVTIPLLVIILPLTWLLIVPPGVTLGGQIVFAVLSAITQIPTICAFAAAASHIFRALADQLGRQPA